MADLLLVEDDEDQRDLLAGLLRREGHAVRAVRDGALGLQAFDQRRPELVISDTKVPVLDGAAVVYRLLIETLSREEVPVILVSAHPRLPEVSRAIGTPYYLQKPFDFQTLKALIRHALDEGRPPLPHTP